MEGWLSELKGWPGLSLLGGIGIDEKGISEEDAEAGGEGKPV